MNRPTGTTGGSRQSGEARTAASIPGAARPTEPVTVPTPGSDVHPSPAEVANPVVEAEAATPEAPPEGEEKGRRFSLGMDRFSGLYVWAALIIVFAIWVP